MGKEQYYDLEIYDENGRQIDTLTITKEHYNEFVKKLLSQAPITDGNLSISHRYKLEDLLKCRRCGMPFNRLDEHNFENACSCLGKTIRISVGN